MYYADCFRSVRGRDSGFRFPAAAGFGAFHRLIPRLSAAVLVVSIV